MPEYYPGKVAKKQDCLSGIHCDVTNCEYNVNGKDCHAENIVVGPHGACQSKETECSTFRQKNSGGAY